MVKNQYLFLKYDSWVFDDNPVKNIWQIIKLTKNFYIKINANPIIFFYTLRNNQNNAKNTFHRKEIMFITIYWQFCVCFHLKAPLKHCFCLQFQEIWSDKAMSWIFGVVLDQSDYFFILGSSTSFIQSNPSFYYIWTLIILLIFNNYLILHSIIQNVVSLNSLQQELHESLSTSQ